MDKELAALCAKLLREFVYEGPRITGAGICSNLVRSIDAEVSSDGSHLEVVMPELRIAFKSWPKYSGDEGYPVPHTEGGSAWDAYNQPNLWDDDAYGNLRADLALHCAKHFDGLAA